MTTESVGPIDLDAQQLRDAIRRFIVETLLFGDGQHLQDDTEFIENGILDSTGVLEVVAFLESNFGVAVADAEMLPDNLDSINRLVGFVQSKKRLVSVKG